ncbi:MAG: CPP1-like family protein [Scytonema sp. PMC 1070.18]|nr:CPP1-like family protein [Scytonema sp. PMC 1070.18]
MSEQSPYEKLGVSEDASFDEVQDVRNRLLEQHNGDAKRVEVIEAAYDAILMDRLRMRQEGKIKVPERIRYPERLVQAPPKESSTPREQSPAWLQNLLDRPTSQEVLLPGIWYLGLSTISLLYRTSGDQVLPLILVVGIGVSIYFLNRKQNRFGRSVLLTLIGLVTGLIAGGLVAAWLLPLVPPSIPLTINQFSTVITLVLLWLISSFIK